MRRRAANAVVDAVAATALTNCSNTGSAPIWNTGRRGAAAIAASVMFANSSAEFGAVMRSDTSSMLTKP